jgi:thiol-disulfide isomerase/thioredoxin
MTTRLTILSAVLLLEAAVILGVGISGIVTRKPLVYRSRWVLWFFALAMAPAIFTSGEILLKHREVLGIAWFAPVMLIFMVVILWFQLQGFSFIGISDETFRSALHHALGSLGIPFEESLSGVRLRGGEGGVLKVSLQNWVGTGMLTITPRTRQGELNAIVREMRRFFTENETQAKLLTNIFFTILGALLVASLIGSWLTVGRLVQGRSQGEWVGRAAPEFRLRTLTGESQRLSEHVGRKVVLLNFFATWCAPCREEMPGLARLQQMHAEEGLLVVGIDADEAPDDVRALVARLGVGYPVGIDRGWIRGTYRVGSYPTSVLIGVDGRIIDYRVGGEVDGPLTRHVEQALSRRRSETDRSEELRAAWSREVNGAIPEHLREARVLENRLGLRKSTFLEYEVGGELVTDIEAGASREWPDVFALVTDREGARLVDAEGRSRKEWRFATRMRFPRIVKTGRDIGERVLVDDGAWDETKAVASDGSVLWSRSGSGANFGVAAGHLEGDEAPEFVIWKHDTPGLEVLDERGSLLRKLDTPDPVRDVKILERGSGGEPSILYSILDRDLVELDRRGRVLARHKPDAPALNYLAPVVWTALSRDPVFIQTYWDTLNLLTPSGERVTTLRAPSLRQQLLHVPVRAASARFAGHRDADLIVVTRLYSHPRTVLHVFDREGALLYHELLEEMYAGLGVITGPSGETRSFLLGGEGRVLKYALAG